MGFHEDGEIILKDLVQGQVARKTVKFNPGLSQILSKVFLSKNMQLELYTKYCEPLLDQETVIITTQNFTLSNT